MVISEEHIEEFQMLYKKHYGVEITKAQALEKGQRLVRLIEAVSRTTADEQGSLKSTDNNK